ncbi:MAG: catalase [Sandaracinus sp.]|nr:catalase [Myxococcales bacterium]MCB9617225.1 catalase [Sandaracinus sp.]MCB9618474.1 catalase [Sandaracinus sp.]
MTDSKRPTLTNDAGNPISNDTFSVTAGPGGPVLLQDHRLVEKLARFNRERIPERIVHAVGSGAYGTFTVTSPDVPKWTKMKLFADVGKKTEVFLRFSTVAASRGGADTARDPRGFAVKFYTEDGNWDLVGNNTPVFFLRDGLKFPDFIHSQKYDPYTNRQEPDNVWDFFAASPESTHQFVWLFGDRGIPASLRHTDGFGSHTFLWVNAEGERFWVKFHFKTDQGIRCLDDDEAAAIGGRDPQHHQKDLYDAIERGEHPSWTLKVQVMPFADAATYRFDPFDLTKVWPYEDYPLIEVGKLVLDRTPDNYFAEVEQSAFDPGHMPPGIGPSPDRMLQARLFAYGDAHRYRLGINHVHLAVNAPKGVAVRHYGRDGAHADGKAGRAKNFWPTHGDGPAPTGEAYDLGYELSGSIGIHPTPTHRESSDFVQAGALYRVMKEDEKARLVRRLAGSLAQVTRPEVIAKSVEHFDSADADLGARLRAALKAQNVEVA